MGELRCTLRQAQDGVAVPLDESTTIIVVPAVAQVTLKGRAFDAGRTFLLPRAMNALNEVWSFATRMQAKHAVVVAHVEAVDAEPDALSKARATVAQSWLAGDTAPWLKQFESSVPEAERWGAREDKYLLSVALGGAAAAAPKAGETGDPQVRAFQTLVGVKVDGIAGPVTRGKLLEKYFAVASGAVERRQTAGQRYHAARNQNRGFGRRSELSAATGDRGEEATRGKRDCFSAGTCDRGCPR